MLKPLRLILLGNPTSWYLCGRPLTQTVRIMSQEEPEERPSGLKTPQAQI